MLLFHSTHHNFVVLADGHGANVVFRAQLFAQRRRHQLPADVRRRLEVPLAVLPARRGHL